jgi:hypothetical protein
LKLLLFWFPALAGLQPALAGCVHEAGLVIVAGAGPPVVGEQMMAQARLRNASWMSSRISGCR